VEAEPGPRSNVPSLDDVLDPAPRRGWSVDETPVETDVYAVATAPSQAYETSYETKDLRSEYKAAVKGRGTPPVAAIGWMIFGLGLLMLTYAYWDVYATNEETILSLGGVIRLDALGLLFMLLGLVMAVAFHLAPSERSKGPRLEDSGPDDWVHKSRMAHARATTHRILAIVGWVVFVLGVLITVVALRQSWLESAARATEVGFFIGDTFYRYWPLGLIVAASGLVTFLLTYPRMHNAQQARLAYLLAAIVAQERPPASAQVVVAPAPARHQASGEPPREVGVAGVAPERVKVLMRRIDQLLSKLPEDEVAEFARSPEAEAYLKILESS
jgi:hypothetical protein